MAGHSFVYMPNKDIIMEEYLCDCQECLCLNFVPCIKSTSKFFEKKSNSEDCLLDVKNDPTEIFGFVTTPSFVTVKSRNTSESIYFVKTAEKNVTKENLTDLDMKYPPENAI